MRINNRIIKFKSLKYFLSLLVLAYIFTILYKGSLKVNAQEDKRILNQPSCQAYLTCDSNIGITGGIPDNNTPVGACLLTQNSPTFKDYDVYCTQFKCIPASNYHIFDTFATSNDYVITDCTPLAKSGDPANPPTTPPLTTTLPSDFQKQRGVSCVKQLYDCGPNGVNLISKANYSSLGDNTSQFKKYIDEKYGSSKECINTKIASTPSIILVADPSTSPTGLDPKDIVINTGFLTNFIPRACQSGTFSQTINVDKGSLGSGFHSQGGCCPSGFTYTYSTSFNNSNNADFPTVTACCYNTFKGGGFTSFDGSNCYYNNSLSVNKDSKENKSNMILNTDYLGGNSPRITGLPLNDTSNLVIYQGNKPMPAITCGKNSTCAIDNTKGVNLTPANTISNLTNSNCDNISCFEPGQVLGVGTPSGGEKSVYKCNKDGSAFTIPLINNSVDQTLAVEKADILNKAPEKACLLSGGIYIFNGCVDTTPTGIITGIIRISLGIMGGVALLELIVAGIMYQSGDETKIKEARDRVFATISGVALLVFSILVLRIIGVNVLDILPKGSV